MLDCNSVKNIKDFTTLKSTEKNGFVNFWVTLKKYES